MPGCLRNKGIRAHLHGLVRATDPVRAASCSNHSACISLGLGESTQGTSIDDKVDSRLFLHSTVFFPKDSYLGELRLFLCVQGVANVRRLGYTGACSVRRAGGCARRPDVLKHFRIFAQLRPTPSGSDFPYTEMPARPRVDFIYKKNFRAVIDRGTMRSKMAIFK